MKWLALIVSHALALGAGVGLGVYLLPIWIAPHPPSAQEVVERTGPAALVGTVSPTLRDSDWLHWGEGTLRVGPRAIGFVGEIAPGPDYKLYLSPEFVETEADFLRLKDRMVRVGDVRTFRNFLVPVPEGVDPTRLVAAIVWCETFGQFITAARYR